MNGEKSLWHDTEETKISKWNVKKKFEHVTLIYQCLISNNTDFTQILLLWSKL